MRAVLLIAGLLATACGTPAAPPTVSDPLALLDSREPSPFSVPFWAREAEDQSIVWTQARTKCLGADLAAKPNCGAVLNVAAFELSLPHEDQP